MTLPTNRDITINPADPIPSTLLNKLQDLHVGAKHPELEHGISAGGWNPKAPANAVLGAGQWTINNTTMVADLDWIPIGDRITTVNWSYNPAAVSLQLQLCRRKMDGTAEEVLFTVTDSTGAVIEQSLQTYNTTTVSGYVYYLQAIGNAAGGQTLIGASVKHDRL